MMTTWTCTASRPEAIASGRQRKPRPRRRAKKCLVPVATIDKTTMWPWKPWTNDDDHHDDDQLVASRLDPPPSPSSHPPPRQTLPPPPPLFAGPSSEPIDGKSCGTNPPPVWNGPFSKTTTKTKSRRHGCRYHSHCYAPRPRALESTHPNRTARPPWRLSLFRVVLVLEYVLESRALPCVCFVVGFSISLEGMAFSRTLKYYGEQDTHKRTVRAPNNNGHQTNTFSSSSSSRMGASIRIRRMWNRDGGKTGPPRVGAQVQTLLDWVARESSLSVDDRVGSTPLAYSTL